MPEVNNVHQFASGLKYLKVVTVASCSAVLFTRIILEDGKSTTRPSNRRLPASLSLHHCCIRPSAPFAGAGRESADRDDGADGAQRSRKDPGCSTGFIGR